MPSLINAFRILEQDKQDNIVLSYTVNSQNFLLNSPINSQKSINLNQAMRKSISEPCRVIVEVEPKLNK